MKKLIHSYKKILVLSVSLVGVLIALYCSPIAKATTYNAGSTVSTILKARFTLEQPIVITDITGVTDPFGRGTHPTLVKYGWASDNTLPTFAGSNSPVTSVGLIGTYKVSGTSGAKVVLKFKSDNTSKTAPVLINSLGATQTLTMDTNNFLRIDVTGADNGGACYPDNGYPNTGVYGMFLATNDITSCQPISTDISSAATITKGTGYFDIYLKFDPRLVTLRGNVTVVSTVTVTYP